VTFASRTEQAKRIKELEAATKPAPEKVELGEKPTLASCDYDDDEYELKLAKWLKDKDEADKELSKAEEVKQRAAQRWQEKVQRFEKAKAEIAAPDLEDAEAFVLETLSPTQQAIIVDGADNPAVVLYALGKNQTKAKELAALDNHVEFAFAIAKLEGQLKVTKSKTPAPEKAVRGGSGVNSAATLDALRAEAEKTGDYTKVRAFKSKMRG